MRTYIVVVFDNEPLSAGVSFEISLEAAPLVQFNNTSLERFTGKYHSAICPKYITTCHIWPFSNPLTIAAPVWYKCNVDVELTWCYKISMTYPMFIGINALRGYVSCAEMIDNEKYQYLFPEPFLSTFRGGGTALHLTSSWISLYHILRWPLQS